MKIAGKISEGATSNGFSTIYLKSTRKNTLFQDESRKSPFQFPVTLPLEINEKSLIEYPGKLKGPETVVSTSGKYFISNLCLFIL